jgi:hypothetical protein
MPKKFEIPPEGLTFVTEYDLNDTAYPILGVVRDPRAGLGQSTPAIGTAHPDTARYPDHTFVGTKVTQWDQRILWLYRILPGPQVTGQDYVPSKAITIEYTEQDVKSGTADGEAFTTVTPVSVAQDKVKVWTVPVDQYSSYVRMYPMKIKEIPLPRVLNFPSIDFDGSRGQGSYSTTGGASGTSIMLNLDGKGNGSASVTPKLLYSIDEPQATNVDAIQLRFMLPSPVTKQAMIAKINSLLGAGGTDVIINSAGTGYTSAPSVSFSAPPTGGTQMTGSAVMGGGTVTDIAVTSGGSGYTAIPGVTLTGGGGTGASATAVISGIVSGISVATAGSGFSVAPLVSLYGGGGTGAAAIATITGAVNTVTVQNGGSGYSTAPAVSAMGGGGTGFAGTAVLTGSVQSVTMSAGGSYTIPPTASFSGGGGTGAAGVVVVNGNVQSVSVSNQGVCQLGNSITVAFSGGDGIGAAATALTTGIVSGAGITINGAYTVAPTLAIDAPTTGGVTATATAVVGQYLSGFTITAGGSAYPYDPNGVGLVAYVITEPGNTNPFYTPAYANAVTSISGAVTGFNIIDPGEGFSATPTVTITRTDGSGGSGAVFTANFTTHIAGITVTNPGSGYISVPNVTVSGGTGSSALNVTPIVSLLVTGVKVTNFGNLYTSAPIVTFNYSSPPSVTAVATPNMLYVVTGVNISVPGTGYTSAPALAFSSGAAAGTATITSVVQSITITNPGSGYTVPPIIVIDGDAAVATATITNIVSGFTVTDPGEGYTSPPSVLVNGDGNGATGTAAVGGIVTGITITNPGQNYTSAPTVGFSSGAATASATVIPLYLSSVTITDVGSNYTAIPSITFSDGGASVQANGTVENNGVELWPQFFPVETNIYQRSQRVNVTAEANSHLMISEEGHGWTSGTGQSFDISSEWEQIHLPPTIHSGMIINVSQDSLAAATATATQVTTIGTINANTGAEMVATGIIQAYITSTVPPAIPSTGLYLYDYTANDADDGWGMFVAVVLNAYDLSPH